MAQFKAVSENVMHSSSEITDRVYSNFSQKELRNNIDALSETVITASDEDRTIQVLEQTIKILKDKKQH